MNRRIRCLAAAAALAAPAFLAKLGHTQPNDARAAPWTVPRTAGGQPDLQGHWTNDTYTPLERPAELGDKQTFTPEEAAAFFKSRVDDLNGQVVGRHSLRRRDLASRELRQGRAPAHVADPEPKQRPAARVDRTRRGPRYRAQRATQRATLRQQRGKPLARGALHLLGQRRPADGAADVQREPTDPADRRPRRDPSRDDARRAHGISGRPAASATGVQWLAGHSVGRFEGDTLVVDTTNFTPLTNFRGSPENTRQDIFASEHLHVVERFTRTSEDNVHYTFTVDDPETWVQPWSGEMEIRRTEGPIYEYACHEGNLGLANILRAARVAESAAARRD